MHELPAESMSGISASTLPDSPELLRALVYAAPSAIIALDTELRVWLWNEAAERMFGYTAAEVIGQPLPTALIEDENSFHTIQERYTHGEALRDLEVVRFRKDRTRIDVSLSTAPLRNADGAVAGSIGMMVDITGQKAAQRQIAYQASLVDSVSDTIYSTDLAYHIQTWNRAAERVYGWSAAEAIGQVAHEMLQTTYGGTHWAEVTRCLAEHGAWLGEASPLTRAGHRLTVHAALTLLRDEHGQPTGLVVVSRDDTNRKAAEAEVRRLNRELEQRVRERTAQLEASNRELESFAYSVSHDLRAPLRSIDGFTAQLERKYMSALDATAQHYMERVRTGVQRMGALIDGLLNLSRLTRRELRPAPVDLSALAEEVVAGLRLLEPERAVTVTIVPGLHSCGDPELLRAVLENLLGNAWKFTGPVAAARVEFGAQQAGDEQVYFVADNGVGFDMAFADQLFGPFQRLHRDVEFPGFGIGLATAQRILARHGGRIWVDAAEGRGATFYFTLPLPAA